MTFTPDTTSKVDDIDDALTLWLDLRTNMAIFWLHRQGWSLTPPKAGTDTNAGEGGEAE